MIRGDLIDGAVHVFLTGFMGAGKTTVGRLLARELKTRFLDLDELIEARVGSSIPEVFRDSGEDRFRDEEHEALASLLGEPAAVVATGGGTAAFERNRNLMDRGGITVWLNPPFSVIIRRLGRGRNEDRPLFQDEARSRTLYEERLPAYGTADLRVDIDADDSAREITMRITRLLRGMNCAI